MSQITIIGLGLIGTSIGLALKRSDNKHTIIGHDKDRDASQRAVKMGAVDKTHWNLLSACDEADLVILAIPASGIRPTLEALREDLLPGCLIIDTAPMKREILAAAAEILPDTMHFVGGHPILAWEGRLTAANASADLFKKASWAICATPDTAADAIRIAADMVTLIGAEPLFLDADEHDGLVAAAEGMPNVLAAALLKATGDNPAWREIRRMAGSQYESVSYLPDLEAADLTAAVMANTANVAHWLDIFIAELQTWKQDLLTEDMEAITARFDEAMEVRSQWLAIRAKADWEETEVFDERPNFLRRMVGLRPPRAG